MTDVPMPRLSDTMEEGTILRWLKQDGDRVARGEELVEIETDKASMIYESDREGTLQRLASEGETLAVGEPIARIGEGAEVSAPSLETTVPSAKAAALAQTPAPVSESSTPSASTFAPAPNAPTATPNGQATGQPPQTEARVKASPLARRLAREAGVDLAAVHGSGPGGRIVKADVEMQTEAASVGPTTSAQPTAAPAPAPTPVSPLAQTLPSAQTPPAGREPPSSQTAPSTPTGDVTAARGETTGVELSRIQRTIARRMAESKATIPDFTLAVDVDMQECVELRAELKRLAPKGADHAAGADEHEAVVPTYNDMIVKACALALREHPRANGSYRDGRFELHSRVNVGVAVAVAADDPTVGALVVPTVFDADAKALGEIAREARTLAQRVREGSISPPELSGATFTVSNLGMYGIRQFTAIVNPPQAAILAVGEVAPRPVAGKKKTVLRPTMTVTLTCDHRILYGADAALFLARIRALLEEPAALTL